MSVVKVVANASPMMSVVASIGGPKMLHNFIKDTVDPLGIGCIDGIGNLYARLIYSIS